MSADVGKTSPLRNVRVIDLSHVWAGPAACRILADLGAEVIKVERAVKPDGARMGYIADQDYRDDFWNRSLYFHRSNAGKRSVTLDLSVPTGAAAFHELLRTADVLVENYSPRAMRALGFSYAAVRDIRPDIIMLSISAYGQTGPYANYAGYGTGLEPASGIADASGYPGGGPYKNGNTYVDPFAGVLAGGAILAALRYRARTGRGQYIDQSLQETAVQIAGESLLAYQLTGRPLPRTSARSTWTAPQGMYRCAGDDEWLYLSVRSDADWRRFCEVLGRPEWLADQRFHHAAARLHQHDALDELITDWTVQRDKTAAMHELQRNGILAAAVLNAREVLLDPQLAARGFFEPVTIHESGPRPIQRYLAATFSDIEARARGPAPKLGEHNRQVLQGMLGLSAEELDDLASGGVIGREPALALSRQSFERAAKIPLERYVEQGSLAAIDGGYRKVLETVLRSAAARLKP